MASADVVIIGAGVIGASTAFHLARAGVKRVVVVERRHLAAGASGKSGALVRMHYTDEPEVRLALESLRYFQNWADLVGGDCGFRQTGFLTMVPEEFRANLEANVAMQRRVGVNTQLISPDEAREVDPSVWVGDVSILAYEPESGYADPAGTTYAFAQAAAERGAEFRLNCPATAIRVEGGRVRGVETSEGPIEAPVVLLAAGPWANDLLRPLAVDLGLVTSISRVTLFRWAFGRSPKHPIYIDHVNNTWLRPIDGTSTLIGMESGVSRLGGDPNSYSEAVDQSYVEGCREKLVARFPIMRDAPMRGNWAGMFMRSPDSLPIIDQLPQYAGLFCFTGDSGSSFKTSPAIGKCLAEWIVDGRPTTVDLRAFRSTRFAEGQPWRSETGYSHASLTISR
jgi:sarcosine oxidase subunit beta